MRELVASELPEWEERYKGGILRANESGAWERINALASSSPAVVTSILSGVLVIKQGRPHNEIHVREYRQFSAGAGI